MGKLVQLPSPIEELKQNISVLEVVRNLIEPDKSSPTINTVTEHAFRAVVDHFNTYMDKGLYPIFFSTEYGFDAGWGVQLFDKLMREMANADDAPCLVLLPEEIEADLWYWFCAGVAEASEIGHSLQTSLLKKEFFLPYTK